MNKAVLIALNFNAEDKWKQLLTMQYTSNLLKVNACDLIPSLSEFYVFQVLQYHMQEFWLFPYLSYTAKSLKDQFKTGKLFCL